MDEGGVGASIEDDRVLRLEGEMAEMPEEFVKRIARNQGAVFLLGAVVAVDSEQTYS